MSSRNIRVKSWDAKEHYALLMLYTKAEPIISVLIPFSTIRKLNFDLLDPSDSMNNFTHNIDFFKN